jgi:membrane protein YdbS with pleckstrin-like domain
MNKSTIYIIITIILFLAINDPILKFFSNTFNLNFWVSEIVIAVVVIALVYLISRIIKKTIFKKN